MPYIVIAAAAGLRLYDLTLKPLHHDEGVNGFFLLGLFREGVYRYNPANYHGPTLYYLSLIICSVNNLLFGGEGPSTRALRILPVLFGIGTVALVFAFQTRLGAIATWSAAGLLALSPGMVYLARDFIHETLLVFFTLWLVKCCLDVWQTRQPRQLMMCAIAAALMAATKETAPISWAAIGGAAVLSFIIVPPKRKLTVAEFGGWKSIAAWGVAAAFLFCTCCVLFFSSFFGNFPQGLRDAVTTYNYWTRTGISQLTAPWFTHLRWLLKEEAPLFLLGAAGTIIAAARRDNRFAIFAGCWGFALLLVYSALPYKTPWLLLNVLVPLALPAGYALQTLWYALQKNRKGRLAFAAAVVLVFGSALYQSVQLNFFHYDDDRYSYPFVQTSRQFLRLVDEIERTAKMLPEGQRTSIAVLSPDYWPLPWYLRDYKNAGYYGKLVPTTASIVIVPKGQGSSVAATLPGYERRGSYPLRPGVELTMFVADHARH